MAEPADVALTTYHDRHRIAALPSLISLVLTCIVALFGSDRRDPGGHGDGANWFVELAKHLSQAEFQVLDGIDAQQPRLGQQIQRAAFEHNLIIVEKAPDTVRPNLMRRE